MRAQLERALRMNQLPARGQANQTLTSLLACMARNAWARYAWQRELARQQAPPGQAA